MAEPIDSFVIYGSKEEVELKRQQMDFFNQLKVESEQERREYPQRFLTEYCGRGGIAMIKFPANEGTNTFNKEWVMCQQLLDRFPVRDEFSKVEQQVFENESVALSTQG